MTTGTESKLFKAVSQCELSLYSLIFVSLIHFIPFFSSILMLKYLFFSATPCFGFPSSTHNFLPCLLSPNFFFSVSETSYPPSMHQTKMWRVLMEFFDIYRRYDLVF
jgi:hypothetical protein